MRNLIDLLIKSFSYLYFDPIKVIVLSEGHTIKKYVQQTETKPKDQQNREIF